QVERERGFSTIPPEKQPPLVFSCRINSGFCPSHLYSSSAKRGWAVGFSVFSFLLLLPPVIENIGYELIQYWICFFSPFMLRRLRSSAVRLELATSDKSFSGC